MKDKLIQAQALLLSRAAVLLKVGRIDRVGTDISFGNEGLYFFCGREEYAVSMGYEDEAPFDMEEINKVLVAMDMEIAMARKDAQNIVNIIENWEA